MADNAKPWKAGSCIFSTVFSVISNHNLNLHLDSDTLWSEFSPENYSLLETITLTYTARMNKSKT